MADDLRESALDYHQLPRPGKLASMPMARQRVQSLAYSPGISARSIADLDPYTPSLSILVYRLVNALQPVAEAHTDH